LTEADEKDVIILDLYNNSKENVSDLDDNYLDFLFSKIKDTGSLWIIVNNKYAGDILIPNSYDIADKVILKGLCLRNIIIWFLPLNNNISRLTNRYAHILFFVKEPKQYFFDKDTIREKHIWKDVEWGKRESRYNPLGKDPSNFWLMIEDDSKGRKTKHIPLNFQDVIKRIILCSCPKGGNALVFTNKKINYPKSYNISCKRAGKYIEKKQIKLFTCKKSKSSNLSKRKTSYKVLNKSSENMKEVKNNSINLIVTSPPYWDMKNYQIKDQIGYSDDYEEYLTRIRKVWKECYRVLSQSGSFWLNINSKTQDRRIKMMQFDFYKQCISLGFKLWDIIIWHKSVSGPAADNNLTDKFEYVLVFYKSNISPLINKSISSDYLIKNLKGLGNVWNINRKWGNIGKGYPHPAMYPDELIERILNIATVENDLVLDPFLGSGTTLIVSRKTNRSCIGYEINKDYFKILKERLTLEQEDTLFNQYSKVEFA